MPTLTEAIVLLLELGLNANVELKPSSGQAQATGEVVAVAVIDTGRSAPAVVLAGVPNTHRAQWPDINLFFSRLKPITKATE